LVSGDHGSDTGGQVSRQPNDWSDADIAERFSILMAYKLPEQCKPPELADPMNAMNAILSCTVDGEFVTPPPQYLIGAEDPEPVAPERMAQIKSKVASGSLPPDSE
jgi:hypothetical protein